MDEFCDSTSLHGWSFFGGKSDDGKWTPNGLFWLTVIIVSIISAVYVVGYTIQGHLDYQGTPRVFRGTPD
jgi:hypothetical protein